MSQTDGTLRKRLFWAAVGKWLLIVFALVGLTAIALWVVANAMFPSTGDPHGRVKLLIKDIQIALKNYHTEYGRWPDVLIASNVGESTFEVSGPFVRCLLGESIEDGNPRAIRFADFSRAEKGRSGLVETIDGELAVADSWGLPFLVSVDANGDNAVPNPEAGAPESMRFDQEAPQELPVPVIIFSAGPDKDPDTWNDNITSWRH